eukprot:jgi/Chrzof1/2520/Cz11g18190.t1
MLQSSNHSATHGAEWDNNVLSPALDPNKLSSQQPLKQTTEKVPHIRQLSVKASPKKRPAAIKIGNHPAVPSIAKFLAPLVVEDDSKPANFADLGNLGMHCSVLLRPPHTKF